MCSGGVKGIAFNVIYFKIKAFETSEMLRNAAGLVGNQEFHNLMVDKDPWTTAMTASDSKPQRGVTLTVQYQKKKSQL